MKVIALRTEKLSIPLGIDQKNPEFSWQIEGENVYQKKYKISVATKEELLRADEADMWDSGEVYSSDTFGVAYAGKDLKSCTRYFWKVSVNDTESDIAWFETAFLNPEEEFKAFWIGQPLGFAGSVDDVRVELNIDKPVKSSRFYVAALGTGRFYLNGELLEDNYFDGSVSVYGKTIYYRTYELRLNEKKNTLCAKLGYGFYGAKKLYGIVRIVYADGNVELLPTIPGRLWNIKRDAVRLNGVYDGEVYDANYEEDWMNPDYKVTFGNWVATFATDAPSGSFKANPVPPMKIVDTFAPLNVEKKDGGYLVHTGVNVTGFLTITAKAKKGERYTVTHAERLTESGGLDNANLRAAECKDTYIFKGDGEEKYTPEFTYHSFEYAYIETTENVEIIDIKVNYLRSAVEPCGGFECSEGILNNLHKIAVQTEGNNLNGVFTDCPQRDERLGWLNDLTSRIYQSLCNFRIDKYLANFIDMITESQFDNGIIPDTVPFEVGAANGDFISAYTVLGILCYKWYGDKRVIERNYDGFAKWINYIKSDADANGGVAQYSLYGDWCPALIYAESSEKDTFSKYIPKEFMSAVYFLWYLKHMKSFAEILKKNDDACMYARYYDYYKRKFDEKYFNANIGMYGNASQGECAVAMTVFCEATEQCALWAKAANEDIIAKDYHMTCGNQTYRHLIYNLSDYGYEETIEKMLKNPEYPGYGFMLRQGATTVWERWENSVGSDMHSFNHPMFSAYDGYFYNYVLGIRTQECTDAFKNIVISPCFLSSLTYAEGYLDTIRGRIHIRWKKAENSIDVVISVPANTNLIFRAKGKEIIQEEQSARDELRLTNGTFKIKVR